MTMSPMLTTSSIPFSARIKLFLLVLATTQPLDLVCAFVPTWSNIPSPLAIGSKSCCGKYHQYHHKYSSRHAVQQDQAETVVKDSNAEAARLRKEAEIMRLQAEQMDLSLTLQKIGVLESKLKNQAWLAKHPDQEAELLEQLKRLNDKLGRNNKTNGKNVTTIPTSPAVAASTSKAPEKTTVEQEQKQTRPASTGLEQSSSTKKKKLPVTPLAGFDQDDLDLYIPIANDINKMVPNATMNEKLELFRTAPELQAHFQKKIQSMLAGPLEDLQQIEQLREEYLDSNSSKERERLKREIERLENEIEQGGSFQYSESFYCDDLEPLGDEDLARRLEVVGSLPDILIAIFKQRNGLGEDDDLSLAVQMDYYEPQLQLLEQVRAFNPLPDELRESYIQGFNSLPKPVQQRVAQSLGVDKDSNAEAVLLATSESTTALSPLLQVVEAANVQMEPSEYNDIEFVDRSRFLEEFFPAIGNMEGKHPSAEDVEKFASEILDRKTFMVTSKPERVAGGYYIRGTNLLTDDEDGRATAGDKLVANVAKSLALSPLGEKLDFFYVLDPSPPTDEELEFGPTEKPIFVVTTKDPKSFYRWLQPQYKISITLTGIVTTILFSVGACALNPSITERFSASLNEAVDTGLLDLQWLTELCYPMLASFFMIQFAHELGHRIIAFRDKFEIGFPTVIPSITTGLTGTITPLRSPPPNSKSMFDFAIAGPLAGLVVSLGLLWNGLDLTSTSALGAQFPVLPVDLLRSSSLGGGLVEYFLGSTAVLPNQGPEAVLPLHPFAVAGFIGLLTNALALLPLGHTDGGRIAVAMFGRKGAFVVKLFTSLLLCAAGLFGLDKANIFLLYVLYVSIWQRELETPARNEIDELDLTRGFVAITAALIVGLVLIPMLDFY